MIYWYGKHYELIPHAYNGEVLGYLFDGELRSAQPPRTVVKGHIVVDNDVIVIVRRDRRHAVLAFLLLVLLLSPLLFPRTKYEYFPVTFAPYPVYDSGVLYCNVVNEALFPVTVQFLRTDDISVVYTINPGESLPYCGLEFAPQYIQYNGEHNFVLNPVIIEEGIS